MGETAEWTWARAARAAAIQLLLRSAVALVLSAAAAATLVLLIHALEGLWEQAIESVSLAMIVVFGVVFGYPQGLVMSRGLDERTGLSGGALLAVTYALLVGLHLAAYALAVQVAPGWHEVFVYLFPTLGIVNLVAAGKTLLVG